MDFNNMDLESSYERDQYILDPISFNTLLLEIKCNLSVKNEITIRKQFETDLKMRIQDAKDIFEANLKNIVKHSNK